jgi:hypothetical protein
MLIACDAIDSSQAAFIVNGENIFLDFCVGAIFLRR